jgi:hypothetical protein
MAGHETLRTRMMAFQDQPYEPLAVRTRMMAGQDVT